MHADADFTDFAAARWPTLVRAAVFLGCRPDDAQDVAQTALVRCYTSWRRVSGADDPDAYAYRVLVNCVRDSQRQRGRRAEVSLETGPESPATDQPRPEVLDAIDRALSHLSPEQRTTVVLRYLADLSEEQTAQVMAVPRGTVKSRLSRALTTLATSTHIRDLDPDGGTR